MAKSLGAYRGYGCLYERASSEHHFILTFYRYGYRFDQSFTRDIRGFEYNLNYAARQIIDKILELKLYICAMKTCLILMFRRFLNLCPSKNR